MTPQDSGEDAPRKTQGFGNTSLPDVPPDSARHTMEER
jgi:hypothetical protein